MARVSLDDIDSRYPYALMIPQSETERMLEERLASARRQGRAQRVELESFADKGTAVEAVLRKADGESETVTGRLAGRLRRRPFDGAPRARLHLRGLDAGQRLVPGRRPRHRPRADRTGCTSSGTATASSPSSRSRRDRWRVIADLGAGDGQRPSCRSDAGGDPGAGRRIAARRIIVIKDPIWLAAFRINERKVKDYRRGRVFLAGDAAHIHSPAGGQGMNTGMQDAFNLAWKLALVIKGIAKPSLLDSYSPERSAVGDRVLRNAGRMTEAAIAAQSGAPGPAQRRGASSRSGFPQIGARAWPTARRDGYRLSREPADGRRARITRTGPRPASAGRSACRRTPASRASSPSARQTPSPTWRRSSRSWCRRHRRPSDAERSDLMLVRPDGYVGFAGAAADRAGAEAYLRDDRGVDGGPSSSRRKVNLSRMCRLKNSPFEKAAFIAA